MRLGPLDRDEGAVAVKDGLSALVTLVGEFENAEELSWA